MTVAQVAIGLLRQQLAPGQQVHGIVTDGGQAANVIPGHAAMRYAMRATDTESLRELGRQGVRLLPRRRAGHRL